MLSIRDFFHLPQVDPLLELLSKEDPGLILVAGLDQREFEVPVKILPSGRTGFFRILVRQILDANPSIKATVLSESRDAFRVPRRLYRRVHYELIDSLEQSAERIDSISSSFPDLLIVDRLFSGNVASVLGAAQSGVRVLAQLDTLFRGSDVLREMKRWGVSDQQFPGVKWIVALQRIPILCDCKSLARPSVEILQSIQRRYPHLNIGAERDYFIPGKCDACEHTGRRNEITAFDFYRHDPDNDGLMSSLLPLESYLLGLVESGYIPLEDILQIDRDHVHYAYQLLSSAEQALLDTKSALERKIVEVEAANRVLQDRTQELVSLQEIGQALIGPSTLRDLARLVCRQASLICGADRTVFYYYRDDEVADVLATHGWAPGRVPQRVSAQQIRASHFEPELSTFHGWPPGVDPRHPDVEGQKLMTGLRVPLIAQGNPVGALIVHATTKSRFKLGEVALLNALANQAAVAIQRAGLIDSLQNKVAQLEAAQASLAQKERMERELELAHEVQQSVLPRTFPHFSGYDFAARNRPARQVGGDFYDVITLGPDRFGIVVADVSDKGMPAAVYMALSRSLMVAEARREDSPAAVLRNVNKLLRELGRARMFVTIFYGVIDTRSCQMTYARAGHNRPLLLRGRDVIELKGEGVFLGYLDSKDFFLTEESIRLQPGDRLVLYTDGLTDTVSPSGERFDLSGLCRLFKGRTQLRAIALCDLVFDRLIAYQAGADQFDDMTLLVVTFDPFEQDSDGISLETRSQEN